MKNIYGLVCLVVNLFCGALYAQTVPTGKNEAILLRFSTQNAAKLAPSKYTIEQQLGLSKKSKLVLQHSTKDYSGFIHERVQQYHQGVKVEYGVYNILKKNGLLSSVSGEKYSIAEELNTQPTLTEETALQHALQHVGARTYKWQIPEEEAALKVQEKNTKATYLPKGELVICKVFINGKRDVENEMALAYKFDIYAHEPLSRAYLYVNAHDGRIIHQDAIIKHATGIAATRYSGTKNIETEKRDTTHRLRDYTRGTGIETYNLRNSTSYSFAVDFFDKDNNWTAAEFNTDLKDNAALDAHWGAMMTYDYFKNVHGRNSFDGNGKKIKNYVHYSKNYSNAFWNGSVMTYGDGGTNNGIVVQPFVTLDIVAHEISHAICENTARLVYSYEPGALNEGFSDIWAATIEYYADPSKKTWLLGEETNVAFRSMSNPKEYLQPDTYQGQYWYTGIADNGGVHINSGVLNHWFYILSVGKSGVNDHGDAFAVSGITMQKAAQIAYRTESIYLTSNSKYADMRKFSIQAAIDLFGENSNETLQTMNAWYAVGVYDMESAPSLLTATASATRVELSWTDNATNETGFVIERSLKLAQDFVKIATIGANTTRYTDKGILSNALYYYRVRTQNGQVLSGFSNVANAAIGQPTITMETNTIATCQAVFLDPGGAANYGNGRKTTMTFSPSTPGSKLSITFSSFDLEKDYDFLMIYDGATTSAPFIGKYTGTTLPPVITAKNSAGQLTFYFVSDDIINKAGWVATLSCIGGSIPAPIVNSFSPESGIPGSTVIIKGLHFQGATAVYFNDTPAEFTINSNTQLTAIVPANAGKGTIRIITGTGDGESSSLFTVTPIITLSELTYTYDGLPKSVKVHTNPANLPVTVLYNQSSALPVNAGVYEVTATIEHTAYQGTITGTLTINQAEASIILGELTQTYSGIALIPSTKTIPAGLPVSLSYNDLATTPVNAGIYTVNASINNPNYKGKAQGIFTISKAAATILLTNTQQTYTGTPTSVIATTSPAGLLFNVAYNNTSFAPTNAGTYQVSATITNPNYEGAATGTLVINKASQTIELEHIGDKYFGDTGFTLLAKASSQLPVDYSIVKGAAIIANNVINLTGAGQVTIRISQAGNENYMAATIERTICVKPGKPIITSSQANTDNSYILTSSSQEGNEWLLNGEPIVGATTQTLQVTKSGNYAVKITIDGCTNVSEEVTITVPTSRIPAVAIQVYPNPASDKIAIDITHMTGALECITTVYNIMGEKVAEKAMNPQSGGWQSELTISHLTPGRYIIQVTNGQQQYSKTFVKQ
ncbi:MBG domain-containing protein [Rhodocytophaga aerolata]|uniref:MBG domain-containing protein n=1 Tax=Rhodocytophaga aerolata TaxID=455078 RepID=A0ABT8R1X9_9BACT|nr:MBG domain-containing protein [Rhodocytophaga aerolata]MDO1446106.1 MBG domain-containing protein [Rhodocytophaga aerolata]